MRLLRRRPRLSPPAAIAGTTFPSADATALARARYAGAHVLLVAPPGSYRIRAYVEAARELAVPLAIVSQGHHSVVPEVAAGIAVDLADPIDAEVRVREVLHGAPVAGVVATDDATSILASRLADSFGLPHSPSEAVATARRKDRARDALDAAGIAGPAHRTIDTRRPLGPQLAGVRLPCVVKPLAMSASRGVIRADDRASLRSACDRAGRIASEARDPFEATHLLVEDYMPGREVAVEGLLSDGDLRVLAIFDKPDPLDGPFFEETYYVTPSRLPPRTLRRLERACQAACRALGLTHGPVHAELRVHGDAIGLLEVAARTIGGDCARLLRFGTGLGLEEIVLRHAAGLPVELQAAPGAAGVLMLPTPRAGVLRRVEGVLGARAVPGVEEVVIAKREGYELVPLPEGGDYLGFVFARADEADSVEAALRAAHARLEVVVAGAWRLEPRAAP